MSGLSQELRLSGKKGLRFPVFVFGYSGHPESAMGRCAAVREILKNCLLQNEGPITKLANRALREWRRGFRAGQKILKKVLDCLEMFR